MHSDSAGRGHKQHSRCSQTSPYAASSFGTFKGFKDYANNLWKLWTVLCPEDTLYKRDCIWGMFNLGSDVFKMLTLKRIDVSQGRAQEMYSASFWDEIFWSYFLQLLLLNYSLKKLFFFHKEPSSVGGSLLAQEFQIMQLIWKPDMCEICSIQSTFPWLQVTFPAMWHLFPLQAPPFLELLPLGCLRAQGCDLLSCLHLLHWSSHPILWPISPVH